jgi:hypothetical protein
MIIWCFPNGPCRQGTSADVPACSEATKMVKYKYRFSRRGPDGLMNELLGTLKE